MQIIYAAPFVLISVVAFIICLAVPGLRRIALAALVVPVAFGVCSLFGWILFALVTGFVLHVSLGVAEIVIMGILFYLLPGLAGAWVAVKLVRFFEQSFLKTKTARSLLLASVIALISAGFGGFLGLGMATNYLPQGSVVVSLWIASASSAFAAITGFLIARMVQSRHQDADVKAS